MTRDLCEPARLELADKFHPATWLRRSVAGADSISEVVTALDVAAAAQRFARFEPILARLFPDDGWNGRICSALLDFPADAEAGRWLVKGDHALPMTGSIKARGGVHEVLCIVEHVAQKSGLAIDLLTTEAARRIFAHHTVVVASTGNLGFSIGVVARAFGFAAEIHMSADAKKWKKDRLLELGASLVEHDCDYSETIARARQAASVRADAFFIDDETSKDLLAGYAVAADEVAEQIEQRGLRIGPDRPLVVYLPCGVGGAPGGITHGLKRNFGANVVVVFVEPTASPCMMVALASGSALAPSVYEFGCDNDTVADGLAVPRASDLVLSAVGNAIDAVVAVPDAAMVRWVRQAWSTAGLRLEPSAAAAFAAHETFMGAATGQPGWPGLENAVHLFWATGGSKIPDPEFIALLGDET